MKIKLLLSCLAICISTLIHAEESGKDCSHNCFSTTINSVQQTEDGCYNYELSVSYSGDCTFALSHFTLDSSCGIITAVSNSEGWKQEIGNTDPTTNLSGFKIDDIKEFGEGKDSGSFTIHFTICPEDNECAEELFSWSPVVAYKAGRCVYYDTIENNYNGGNHQDEDPETDEGEDNVDEEEEGDNEEDGGNEDDGDASENTEELIASLTPVSTTCAESNDGEILLEIASGDAPFTFLWSNGATTQNIQGLQAGTYTVEVKDAQGNALNLTATVAASPSISLNYEITNASCGNGNDGAINVIASGGSGTYSYLWSNGSTDASISSLAPGLYEVQVTDSNGCTYNQSFTVGSVNQLLVTAVVNASSCGTNDGTIDLSVQGGSGEYTFSWLDGATTEDRNNLSPGFYTVTVKDTTGCESSRTFSVKENNPLQVNGQLTSSGCPENNSGAIDLTVSGATGNITYLWSNGATTEDISGVSKGRYEVKVTDENGCSITKSFYVFAETVPLTADVQHPTCFGSTNGAISISSDENISVSWSTGSTSLSISGLGQGVYTATVTSETGCISSYSYYLAEPKELLFTTSVTNATCEANAYATQVAGSGGVAPYTITWSDGFTGAVREGLSMGTYSVTITDSRGCQTSGDIIIDESSVDCTIPGDGPDDDGTTGDDGTDDGSDEENPEDDGSDEDTGNDTPDGDEGEDDGADDDGTGEGDEDEDNGDGTGDNDSGDDSDTGEDDTDSGEGDDNSEDNDSGEDTSDGDDSSEDEDSENEDSENDGTENGDSGDEGSNEDGDSEEDENDDDQSNNGCGDPFSIEITVDESGDCISYSGKIIYSGNKTYGLSHAVISPSCGNISGSYTETGQFENGKDPRTGLNGLKIDEISGFGEGNNADELEFSFELCDLECADEEKVSFVVAYKFGQCITYDTLAVALPVARTTATVYPNPASDYVNFKLDRSAENVNVILYNQMGIEVKRKSFNQGDQLTIDIQDLPDDFYTYRIISANDVQVGKIIVSNK